MNKKVIMVIVGVLLVLIFGICGMVIFNWDKDTDKKVKEDLSSDIIARVDKKEDMLIYVTDKEKECYLCPDANYIIDFYESAYSLEFVYFDKSKTDIDDFHKLTSTIGFEDGYVTSPAVILIREGQVKAVANEMVMENDLREFLIDYKFIGEEYRNTDMQLDMDKFNSIYNSNDISLIAIYTYSKDSYEIRKSLLELSREYGISYYTVYSGVSDNATISINLMYEIGDDYSVPSLVIVQNGKVVDYVNSSSKEDILNFFQKNNIVN